jgi:hypothetical protein
MEGFDALGLTPELDEEGGGDDRQVVFDEVPELFDDPPMINFSFQISNCSEKLEYFFPKWINIFN